MTIASAHVTPEALVGAIGGILILVLVGGFIIHRIVRHRVKPKKFQARWRKLQKKLPDQENWLEALTEADNLLDRAMKKKGIKGDSMGERLVNAQEQFKENDEVWFGHKLCKKHQENPELKLKKNDVKQALIALRQALRDLGAI